LAANHLNKRKADHIELTFRSQLSEVDSRFNYEPLFAASPDQQILKEIPLLVQQCAHQFGFLV